MGDRESTIRAVVAGLALGGVLYLADPIYFVLLLAGPVVTGIAVAARGGAPRWAVVPWLVAGAAVLAYDYAVNREDVAFHVVTTVVTALLARGAHAATALVRRRRVARAA